MRNVNGPPSRRTSFWPDHRVRASNPIVDAANGAGIRGATETDTESLFRTPPAGYGDRASVAWLRDRRGGGRDLADASGLRARWRTRACVCRAHDHRGRPQRGSLWPDRPRRCPHYGSAGLSPPQHRCIDRSRLSRLQPPPSRCSSEFVHTQPTGRQAREPSDFHQRGVPTRSPRPSRRAKWRDRALPAGASHTQEGHGFRDVH